VCLGCRKRNTERMWSHLKYSAAILLFVLVIYGELILYRISSNVTDINVRDEPSPGVPRMLPSRPEGESAPPRRSRTAICLTGQLRGALYPTSRTAWMLKHSVEISQSGMRELSKAGMPPAPWTLNTTTLVELLHERFISIVARDSPVDIFMVMKEVNSSDKCQAHFRPPSSDPAIKDYDAANPNALYCSNVVEQKLEIPEFMNNFAIYNVPQRPQQFIQQLDDMNHCNRMRHEVEETRRVRYDYMIRARPETVFYRNFPSSYRTHAYAPSARANATMTLNNHTVFYGDNDLTCCGNIDTFGIVPRPLMDCYFDRMSRLYTFDVNGQRVKQLLQKPGWIAEHFLEAVIEDCGGNFFETPDLFSHRGGDVGA
jgi:hypothetical protein